MIKIKRKVPFPEEGPYKCYVPQIPINNVERRLALVPCLHDKRATDARCGDCARKGLAAIKQEDAAYGRNYDRPVKARDPSTVSEADKKAAERRRRIEEHQESKKYARHLRDPWEEQVSMR